MTRKLLFLNGLAILAIPIQHATAYGLQAMFLWTDRYRDVIVPNYDLLGSPSYYLTTILRHLTIFSVPGFFLISGYFIAFMVRGKESNVNLASFWPRIKTLLYPFAIWTVIRYVLLRQFPRSVDDVLDPYHFVPVLIQFYFIAPILVGLGRRNWKGLLIGAALLQLSFQTFRYLDDLGVNFPGLQFLIAISPRWVFFGQQFFWLPLGLVYGLNSRDFNDFLSHNRIKLLAAAVIFGVLEFVEYFVADAFNGPAWIGPNFATFSRNFYILFSLLFILASDFSSFRFSDSIKELGNRSFGIYLGNIPFIYVAAVLMYRLTPWALGIQLLYQSVLFAAGLGGPLLLMEIVRRSPARPAYRYIFG